MSYIVPIGPYHPALEEPVHAKLYTEGEVIKDAEVFVGYNHRGIEKLATERNAIQTLVLVERVCGICSHSHAFTYAMAVEGINGVEVPKRGEYIRVITAELDRPLRILCLLLSPGSFKTVISLSFLHPPAGAGRLARFPYIF